MKKVIAVFDIGKTNKKILLFDKDLQVVYQKEDKFPEIVDEDGCECDDIEKIETWLKDTLISIIKEGEFDICAVNFSTYGASLAYIDAEGKRLTPIYNYLKPMPAGIVEPLYDSYGGQAEFSRQTASPALGMLNSGLQALWLKSKRPEVFAQVKSIVHFPQYLSYLFTNAITSEYTSIGCHTAMWDFDHMQYHSWLKEEGINLPAPVSNSTMTEVELSGHKMYVGIGIHDSSASLVPYIKGSKEKFALISTGTWCINMNPFNYEPLTADQLSKDCLCFMSVTQNPVKSSRLFMGYIHEVNSDRFAEYFNVPKDSFKRVKLNEKMLVRLNDWSLGQRVFFKNGVPEDSVDKSVDLSLFDSYEEAYHQLMIDLTYLCIESLELVLSKSDPVKNIFISGGFARNEIFVRLMATTYPDCNVFTSEVDNSSALGAAMVVWDAMKGETIPGTDLGLNKWEPLTEITEVYK
ncbi:MAG: FGGY family carbohydrate kinase [Bacteroidota bacterium]|nr:FGGY family carbohydrate kinase [Bacteroidota bacterium]MDP4204717.1 FGGY family carbohydrate kinase [Bacteroidota bacterium]